MKEKALQFNGIFWQKCRSTRPKPDSFPKAVGFFANKETMATAVAVGERYIYDSGPYQAEVSPLGSDTIITSGTVTAWPVFE